MSIQERITHSMADKIVKAIDDAEVDMSYIEIGEVSEELTKVLKDCLDDDEVRKVLREKMIETIKAIDPEKAAERLQLTWGELLGEFFYKIVNTFKSGK